MTNGVQEVQGVVVFITKRYHYLHLIMQPEQNQRNYWQLSWKKNICNTKKWTRSVDMYLCGKMFIDMSEEFIDQNIYVRR